MKTQTEVLNNLLKNKIDSSDVTDFFNSVKKVDSLLDSIKSLPDDNMKESVKQVKSIIKRLNSSDIVENLESLYEIVGQTAESIEPVIAAGIYERIRILKENVDLFRNRILSQLTQSAKDTLGRLWGDGRINIFLAGGFCGGKTTFIGRLIGGFGTSGGDTSGGPLTACSVVHKNSPNRNLEIFFNEGSFTVEDRGEFNHFLDNYNLRMCFEGVSKTEFKPVRDNIGVKDWENGKILEFLTEANKYPKVFAKIVWNHRKSKDKKRAFLNFANLYDMPGLGGNEEHDKVIEKTFRQEKPDVILYLIDTDRGILGDDEIKALPELLNPVVRDGNEQPPLFCWVYQRANPGSRKKDSNFLEDKKKSLKDLFDGIVSDRDDLAKKYNGLFDERLANYLSKSFILDARGPAEDTEIAQDAVSLVLQKYLCEAGKKYCEEAVKILNDSYRTQLQVVMDFKPDDDYEHSKKNPFIEGIFTDILKSCNNGDNSMATAKRIILDAFAVELTDRRKSFQSVYYDKSPPPKRRKSDGDEDTTNDDNIVYGDVILDEKEESFPFDLKATLKKLESDIAESISEILNAIRLGVDRVDMNKIKFEFWEKYKKEGALRLQRTLFTIQAYHWLKASYDRIAPRYICDIGSDILDNIENDIKRLGELGKEKIASSIIIELDGEFYMQPNQSYTDSDVISHFR